MAAATLGEQLYKVRRLQGKSLKAVAEPSGISAAYLQKLERGEVKGPSPHVLHSISTALEIPYERLMELAGYIVPKADEDKVKPGSVLAYALSAEDITEEEAEELAKYLSWYRSQRPRPRRRKS